MNERTPIIPPCTATPLVQNLLPSHFGSTGKVTLLSTPRGGPLPEHTPQRKLRLFALQLGSHLISNTILVIIVLYALLKRLSTKLSSSLSNFINSLCQSTEQQQKQQQKQQKRTRKFSRSWDRPEKFKNEKVTKDFHYYAKQAGFEIIEQTVETLDGYFLQVWKIVKPGQERFTLKDGKGGYPVLMQHGLFQSSGSFITSEERSLAFWLAEHGGYQVYLGNNRGIFNMGHRKLKRSDPRFWDYNIKELALYDLPALVDHVLKDTGHSKLAFIGHSQGNATMFCSLATGMVPELGSKLSCFVALAPAVYAGPLTEGFPFGALKSMRWRTWRRFFGILDFLPIMSLCVDYLPSSIFGFLGYQMFAFLFSWTDRNWLLRRKLKMFRFTPSPVSSAGIFWWTGYQGFSTRGCVLDPEVERWWDSKFPPLALYHGGKDFLVLAEPLIKRIETHEKSVDLIRNFKLEDGEHCDTFWHADAVEICFHLILEDIEKTRKDKAPEVTEVIVSSEAEGSEVVAIVKPGPNNRLQEILCEPSSCDSKTREQIMNGILSGRIAELGHRFLNLAQEDTVDNQQTGTPGTLVQASSAENLPVVDGSLFMDDRDRFQEPVMHLTRDV
ncbi:uncharacterized protein PGTG_06382 [Puccinia graminis f. sp. tritici CRL 75-36-700-3]|uniref:sterol esterase n=1 Tax=Puccinia graminis f. sp. tritici (strain CRL 75-36-700-3 / race SCCL) TaxID=418459 RepID=E3K840_PUCGT|nr:uncharacterized protein PGTG_06382 [Puccinia graminis f. sp. tritici CRL 75-36-700-3]EFP80426.1 hypothetical protein PGTG_06382 [Puccinia graminis f. sp. tritici CRL 75-36-700-3]